METLLSSLIQMLRNSMCWNTSWVVHSQSAGVCMYQEKEIIYLNVFLYNKNYRTHIRQAMLAHLGESCILKIPLSNMLSAWHVHIAFYVPHGCNQTWSRHHEVCSDHTVYNICTLIWLLHSLFYKESKRFLPEQHKKLRKDKPTHSPSALPISVQLTCFSPWSAGVACL